MSTPSAPPDASGTLRGFLNTIAQQVQGVKTFLSTIIASAGIQVASLFNTNGTGASDVVVKVGTSTSEASTNATAKLLTVRTGLGGSETEKFWVNKNGPAMTSTQAFEFNGDGGGVKLQYRTGDGMAGIWNGAAAYLGLFPGTGAAGCSGQFTSDAGVFKAANAVGVQLFGQTGAGASDVATKVGTSVADGTVNAGAKLLSVRTGVGGTEVERAFFQKGGLTFWGASSNAIKWDNGTPGVSWQIEAAPGTGSLRFGNNTSTYFGLRFSDGYAVSEFGYEFSVGATVYLKTRLGALDQWGTDSTGTPGAATINKPTGKSAIAIGASSVVITNSLVTAASRVIITQHARDATCKELIAVPAAGSFTVSGTANATAALPFSWQVSNIL